MFDFPTPKNEFVNLMRRANDMRLLDLAQAYRDPAARRSLTEYGRLPVGPGVLAEARGPQRPNEVYDTDLKLIFYDAPPFGPYQGWFDAIFSDPAALDMGQNAAAFAATPGGIASIVPSVARVCRSSVGKKVYVFLKPPTAPQSMA